MSSKIPSRIHLLVLCDSLQFSSLTAAIWPESIKIAYASSLIRRFGTLTGLLQLVTRRWLHSLLVIRLRSSSTLLEIYLLKAFWVGLMHSERINFSSDEMIGLEIDVYDVVKRGIELLVVGTQEFILSVAVSVTSLRLAIGAPLLALRPPSLAQIHGVPPWLCFR
jgi:hypothetical protein